MRSIVRKTRHKIFRTPLNNTWLSKLYSGVRQCENTECSTARAINHLVLKARHLSASAFCTGFSRLEVPEQALGEILLGLGLVVKINLLNIHVHLG